MDGYICDSQSTALAGKNKVLLVEDTPSLLTIYSSYIQNAGFEVVGVDSGKKCLSLLAAQLPGVVVLDLGLPDMTGLEILRHIRDHNLSTTVVVVTNNASLATAVEAMRLGAFDYVVKPFSAERLAATVKNAHERQSLKTEVQVYRSTIARDEFRGFIGSSLPMQAVYRIIESAATSMATVFICGESGTGKDVCASAIHAASNRAKAPFVALNCAAIPRDLIESEIFGHVKGAFTGATGDRQGAAAQAHTGTLFLDEICEMSLDMQSKLLRLLQNRTYQQVGGSRTEPADIRFICATNRDPVEEVRRGRFREDLFYRLHVIPILMPPLRERDEDILHIARALLGRFAREEGRLFKGFSPEAEAMLCSHQWPGNVRELQNLIRRAVVLNNGDLLEPHMLPALSVKVTTRSFQSLQVELGRVAAAEHRELPTVRPLWRVEREAILAALATCGGNVTRAAALLEVGVSTLYRKKAEFEQSSLQLG
jgi:two-component system, repressor protein LuxO